MGAAIPLSVREVKSLNGSKETGKGGLSTKGEVVIEVKGWIVIVKSWFIEVEVIMGWMGYA